MRSGSTGGASHGSEYPPVILFNGLSRFVAQLVASNVVLDDLPGLSRLFKTVTTYRIAPYASFAKSGPGGAGVAFVSDIDALIGFDRDFHRAALQAIGVIETQAKTQFGNAMAARHGEYCLYDSRNFIDAESHADTLARVERGLLRRRRDDRDGRFASVLQERATCGVAMESMTLGTFAFLVGNTADAGVLREVASTFGVDLHRFLSWMKLLAAVRNACAHFDKYCVRRQVPCVPRSVEGACEDATRPLYVLLVIEEMLSGRQRFLGSSADGALPDFLRDARTAVAALERRRPHLVDALGVSEAFRGRKMWGSEAGGALPGSPESRSPKAVHYEVVPLVA